LLAMTPGFREAGSPAIGRPRWLGLLWAAPCSLVGALLGLAVLAAGGSARRVGPTVEVALAERHRGTPVWARGLRFSAITFGHVILGQSHEVLAVLRRHERAHVRQYERLGPLFFIAYPGASLLALARGRCPYRDNRFEKQAFAEASSHDDVT